MIRLGKQDFTDEIYDTYLAATDPNGQPLPKLNLNSDCRQFFIDSIICDQPQLNDDKTPAHRNIRSATKRFSAYFREKEAKNGDYSNWLEELKEKVCKKLILTVYRVQHDADAGVIFEVMNNRGKPITEVEKTKNYLLYLASKLDLPAPHDLAKQINATWTRIFTTLMSSECETREDDLLRVHWLMAYDPEEKHWQGCKSIKERFHLKKYVGKHQVLLDELMTYVKTLGGAAGAYCDVRKPNRTNAFQCLPADGALRREEIVEAAEKLPRLGVSAPFLPLLIAIRMKHGGDWKFYLRAVEHCELFAFRVYRLLQRRSNAGRRDFLRLANSLYAGEETPESVFAAMLALTKYFSRDSNVEKTFSDTEFDWYNWTGIRYFLYEYESHLCKNHNKDSPKITWDHLESPKHSIEHILPQTPVDDYWRTRWGEAEQKRFTNDIGNLCLTRDNSYYSNKPFPQKKGTVGADSQQHCYTKANFEMERNLAAYEDWTPETLRKRREKIITWAMKRWSLATTKFEWDISILNISWQFQRTDVETGCKWHFSIPPIESDWQYGQASQRW